MTQIFIFGSSNAYGVGGESGGWADKLKAHLHQHMYGIKGVGEKHELYNFGKPGATIEFVAKNYPSQLESYRNKGRVVAIVSVGGNNLKAEDKPDNFVSSLETYQALMVDLLQKMRSDFDQVLVMGYRPYDESKTLPKPNPLTGGRSYFSNDRRELFSQKLAAICAEASLDFVELAIPTSEWVADYQYADGLHPNNAGYQAIFEEIKKHIVL